MSDRALSYSTGNPSVDPILLGVIGVFDAVFPERVRGYFLTGSYADGTALPFSDIDLTVLFKGEELGESVEQAADRLSEVCSLISPIPMDVVPLAEVIPYPLRAVSLKLGSQFLCGEDVRAALPLPTQEAYARHAVDLSLRLLSRLHGLSGPAAGPLAYPEPDEEFFGYVPPVRRSLKGWIEGGTKDLVTTLGLMATAILTTQTGSLVASKRECLQLYRSLIHDEWTDLIDEVYERCRNQWGYDVPPGKNERRRLRELCARFLEFANRFVEVYPGVR